MRRFRAFILLVVCITIVSCAQKNLNKNGAGENDWQSLFNGQDLNGWTAKIHHHEVGDNYANTFRVKNGTIQVNYNDYDGFNERFGHLFYHEPFSSYHLKFEYRFTEQWLDDAPSYAYRNSGVMFHSQDPRTILKEQDWPISVEYQILADEGDGKHRPTGNMCSPGTEVFFEGEMEPSHCLRSSSKTHQLKEWVKGDLIVYGDSLVIHMVNGDTVLKYTEPQIGGGVVERFDPAIKIDGTPLTQGYIALQSEGQGIEFRAIKLRKIK